MLQWRGFLWLLADATWMGFWLAAGIVLAADISRTEAQGSDLSKYKAACAFAWLSWWVGVAGSGCCNAPQPSAAPSGRLGPGCSCQMQPQCLLTFCASTLCASSPGRPATR